MDIGAMSAHVLGATVWSGCGALAFAWWQQRGQRATRAGRARLLDANVGLVDAPQRSASPSGFACVEGRYRGYAVRLALEEDLAALRKLPSLWLHLSLAGQALPGRPSLDILARPRNTECFSPSGEWDVPVSPQPGWPEDALYRSAGCAPDLAAIDDDVRRLFADDRMKELVVTPSRVRLTYQAKEARRGDYQLLRAAVFDDAPLPAETLSALLHGALRLRRQIERSAERLETERAA